MSLSTIESKRRLFTDPMQTGFQIYVRWIHENAKIHLIHSHSQPVLYPTKCWFWANVNNKGLESCASEIQIGKCLCCEIAFNTWFSRFDRKMVRWVLRNFSNTQFWSSKTFYRHHDPFATAAFEREGSKQVLGKVPRTLHSKNQVCHLLCKEWKAHKVGFSQHLRC